MTNFTKILTVMPNKFSVDTTNLQFDRVSQDTLYEILPHLQDFTERKFSDTLLTERFNEMLQQNYECWKISNESELIGIFGLWFSTRHYVGRSCEPDHIYILPKFQGKGIGTK